MHGARLQDLTLASYRTTGRVPVHHSRQLTFWYKLIKPIHLLLLPPSSIHWQSSQYRFMFLSRFPYRTWKRFRTKIKTDPGRSDSILGQGISEKNVWYFVWYFHLRTSDICDSERTSVGNFESIFKCLNSLIVEMIESLASLIPDKLIKPIHVLLPRSSIHW